MKPSGASTERSGMEQHSYMYEYTHAVSYAECVPRNYARWMIPSVCTCTWAYSPCMLYIHKCSTPLPVLHVHEHNAPIWFCEVCMNLYHVRQLLPHFFGLTQN